MFGSSLFYLSFETSAYRLRTNTPVIAFSSRALTHNSAGDLKVGDRNLIPSPQIINQYQTLSVPQRGTRNRRWCRLWVRVSPRRLSESPSRPISLLRPHPIHAKLPSILADTITQRDSHSDTGSSHASRADRGLPALWVHASTCLERVWWEGGGGEGGRGGILMHTWVLAPWRAPGWAVHPSHLEADQWI